MRSAYLQPSERMTVCEIEDLLYRKSGLLGLSADMRTLLASSDQNAKGVAASCRNDYGKWVLICWFSPAE